MCRTVGPGVAQGASGDYPSVIRECRMPHCGVQLWVSTVHLALVERANGLWPRCWDCQAALGEPVRMHEVDRAELEATGYLTQGRDVIDAMNEWLADRTSHQTDNH